MASPEGAACRHYVDEATGSEEPDTGTAYRLCYSGGDVLVVKEIYTSTREM